MNWKRFNRPMVVWILLCCLALGLISHAMATGTGSSAEDLIGNAVEEAMGEEAGEAEPMAEETAAPEDLDEEEAEEEPTPTVTPAQTAQPDLHYPGITIDATIGYEGRITYLRRLPIRVTVSNRGEESLNGVLAVNVLRDSYSYDRYDLPLVVASQAEVKVELPVELTRGQPFYRLELLVDGVEIASHTVKPTATMHPSTILVGTLSATKASFPQFVFSNTKDPLSRSENWQEVPLTPETFPDNAESMEAFAFLAVDGVDLATLSQRQQEAFTQWLNQGGIVFLGGGAQAGAAYPFFEQFTGIKAGPTSQSEKDITPALLAFEEATGKPVESNVLLCEMQNAKNVLVLDTLPLLDMTKVGDGYVYTAAFSLSDKPLNGWLSTNATWQRVLAASLARRYASIVETYRNLYSRETGYLDVGIMNHIPITSENNIALPMLLLLTFVALVGFGSYAILKKKDKRDWMWTTIPTISLIFAVVMVILSNSMTFKQPIAVISDLIGIETDGTLQQRAIVGLSIAEQEPATIAVQKGHIWMPGNQSNYYDYADGETTLLEQKYVYHLGDKPAMTFPVDAAWKVNSFFVDGMDIPPIKLESDGWWEKDGLHFQLINSGEFPLEPGYLMTGLGYCNVPKLLPGEKADLLLSLPKEKPNASKNVEEYNQYGNPIILAGTLLTPIQQKSVSAYSIMSAMIRPDMFCDDSVTMEKLTQEEQEQLATREMLLNYGSNYWRWHDNEQAVFGYVTFDSSLCDMRLSVNDREVKRTAQQNVIGVKLNYRPISDSGIAVFPRGFIPVFETTKLDDGTYVQGDAMEGRRYYRLQDHPTFCFVLPPEARKIKLTDLAIDLPYSAGGTDLRVYNMKTKEWVAMDPKKSLLKQIDLSVYLSPEGELFVQFQPSQGNSDFYAEIAQPYITLEGGVQ